MVWKIVVLSLAVEQLISLFASFFSLRLLFVAIYSECDQKHYPREGTEEEKYTQI